MTTATIKGWCPGALKPMRSGDGLIVRVRPRLARLTRRQVLGLCDAAERFGSGMIDLTSRANLQLRGISEDRHQDLLTALAALDVLDQDAEVEAKRNLLCTPLWQGGDLTQRLHDAIVAALPRLPKLPGKMGISIDTGPRPILSDTSADFRFERSAKGGLILRADGAVGGRAVNESAAVGALAQMMDWFLSTGGPDNKRMAAHRGRVTLPDGWVSDRSAAFDAPLCPGQTTLGACYAVAFGQARAADLRSLISQCETPAVRITPWRSLILEDTPVQPAEGFVTDADDPVLRVHACPGSPFCKSATVETRALAARLGAVTKGTLHISGCDKGCAMPKAAATTIVGRAGVYDLVKNGAPWDPPLRQGLRASALAEHLDD